MNKVKKYKYKYIVESNQHNHGTNWCETYEDAINIKNEIEESGYIAIIKKLKEK